MDLHSSPPFIFILIILICGDLVAGSYWSEWSRWSECSRTCDGGARFKTRRCVHQRAGRHPCSGEGIGYATCNNKPCPDYLPDFRSEQCAAYNDAIYSGYHFTWLPYNDVNKPCALSCKAEGTSMVATLAPKVLDGTRCRKDSLDMCINGECVHVGCDHILHSRSETDSCGVCGGDNSTCQTRVNRHVDGRYKWIQTMYGPCSVTCGVGVKERRLLCFDKYHGRVKAPKACEHVTRPSDARDTCTPGDCPPEWHVGPWQNCTRDCGGGVSWRIVTCVLTFENGSQMIARDDTCDVRKRPSARKTCNDDMCPTWYAGEWSVCSVSCDRGVQTREVICRHVGDVFCPKQNKPRTVKDCSTGFTCYNLNSDIQERKVGQFAGHHDVQGDQAITKEDLYTPRFVTTTWDSCNASCGPGFHYRYVRCQVFLPYLDDFVDLPDEDCLELEEKPAEIEACQIEPCYDLYGWVQDGVTECSRTCLGGIQETILRCMTKENKTRVDDSFCIEAPHVQTERWVCNDKPCPQRWDLEEYGTCSATCGGGVMSRTVKCIQEYAQDAVLSLPDFMCSQPGPEREAPCSTNDCPAFWNITTDWSECSVTCGRGFRTRRPLCQRMRRGQLVNVARDECDPVLKPETEKNCNMTACPEPMIKENKIQFFQLNKIRRLKLVAGMAAAILPSTNVILKCPHVGLDRQKVTWFKNGLQFRRSKRAKVARSGALRIRSALPGRDNAVYSCLIGGIEAEINITFSSSYDVLQATVSREKYIQKSKTRKKSASSKDLILYKDPIDRKRKPVIIMSTEWSRCSVSCGGGLQSRNLTCELITEDYYVVLPKEECFRSVDAAPALIQSCGVNPCVAWRKGEWSQCSDDGCVRYQYAVQRRQVDCVNQFNDTPTNHSFCGDLGFPPDNVRDCYNPNCTMKWLTSKWSECIADCDDTGFRARTFTCVWVGSEVPAPFGSCDLLDRPRATKKCAGPPCGADTCVDLDDHCEQAAKMNLCRYEMYARRCCKSCGPLER